MSDENTTTIESAYQATPGPHQAKPKDDKKLPPRKPPPKGPSPKPGGDEVWVEPLPKR